MYTNRRTSSSLKCIFDICHGISPSILQLWGVALHNLTLSSEGIKEVLAAHISAVSPLREEHNPEALQRRPTCPINPLQHNLLKSERMHSAESHAREMVMLLVPPLPMQDTSREDVQHDVEQRLQLRGQRVGLAHESADSCKQWSACPEDSCSRCLLLLQGRCQ